MKFTLYTKENVGHTIATTNPHPLANNSISNLTIPREAIPRMGRASHYNTAEYCVAIM